jgi:hypothetical protein
MLYLHPLILGLVAMGLIAQLDGGAVGKQSLSPSHASPDPKGWRGFQWDMTKKQAGALGARVFLDRQGEEHFGVTDIEVLPGKKPFGVELQFFSHIGLTSIRVKMQPHAKCAQDEYETLLRDLREKYGDEQEAKNLEYPNANFLSHAWVVKTTKITLHHSCSKPRSSSSSNNSFQTSIHYEKRLFIELWDR